MKDTSLDEVFYFFEDILLEINFFNFIILIKKTLLYYCTICALYPSLYASSLPSSCTFELENSSESAHLSDENRVKSENESIKNKEAHFDNSIINPELEITSEGLCDYVREIFNLNRQEFNNYQVKAMKKLLLSRSHPQVNDLNATIDQIFHLY